MIAVFADSHYFIALLNERDVHHPAAKDYSSEVRCFIVTTRWVLAEVADALCSGSGREKVADFIALIERHPQFRIHGESDALFDRGLALFRKRPDKKWSLTDCVSFVVMSEEGLTEALTGDHHFEQAGFTAMLRTHA